VIAYEGWLDRMGANSSYLRTLEMLNSVDRQSVALPQPIVLTWDRSPARQQGIEYFQQAADILRLDDSVTTRLGRPEKIIIVSVPVRMDDQSVEVFTGYRVQHNDSRGPYKGGIRYQPGLDLGDVASLAMGMTWKCGLMNLPLGGAKGGVDVDPLRLSESEKEALTRRFTAELFTDLGPEKDIPAPDMGANEQTMAWIMDTYSQHAGTNVPEIVTGKPVECGGSALRSEATGKGVVYSIEQTARQIDLSLDGATFVVHGFGNVGSVCAAELSARGARCVAVADVSGGYVNRDGIPIRQIAEHLMEADTLQGSSLGDPVGSSDVLTVPCDILIPAATGQVIDRRIASEIQCRILAEGANAPTLPEADPVLADNDVEVIPDLLCNAGGVTVSYFEWVQGGINMIWSATEIESRLYETMTDAFGRVCQFARTRGVSKRMAALCLGISNVDRTMARRGLYA
jgi:glutamate dehydrogenase (NAD(P)+)